MPEQDAVPMVRLGMEVSPHYAARMRLLQVILLLNLIVLGLLGYAVSSGV
ncbi:hypothetical protein IT575_15310 [bacterium]|nr:hypothetical protein [bacterium]